MNASLPVNEYRLKLYSISIMLVINLFLLAFSPYLSLILVFINLVIAEAMFGKQVYRYFIPFIIILLAYLASSRGIFETPKDDLSDYYKNFIALSNGNFMALFEWGQGIEIGLPLVSSVLALVVPDAQPRLFLFYHFIVIFCLFFYFFNKLFLRNSSTPAFLIIVTCLFLGFTGIGNLLRQSYASIFLLASFGYLGRKKLFLLIVATLFHFSSPIIYVLIRWLIRPNTIKLFSTLFSLVFLYAIVWKFLLPILEQYSFLKLTAYLTGDDEGIEISTIIRAYKEIVILGIFGLGYYLLKYWKTLAPVYFSVIFLSLVFFFELLMPGISLRLNHAIISFCVGPIVFYVLTARKNISIVSISIIIPCLFGLKIVSFITNPNDMALFDDKTLIYSEPFGYIYFLDEEIANDKRAWKKLKYQ